MIENAKKGQKIYFNQTWVGETWGKVIEYRTTEKGVRYIAVQAENGASIGCLPEDAYATADELRKANEVKFEADVKNYMDSIKTLEDLIRFPMNNLVCGAEEYQNYEAREAYRRRAKELTGVDLES